MIIWNANPIMLQLGNWQIRWYGLLFALSFLLGQQILRYVWRQEGRDLTSLDTATLHVFFGTMIGARLAHVLFYDFAYFSQRPLEIFLPFTFTPTFKFTGYQGLASHGAAIGILTAVYIYVNYAIDIRLWPPKWCIKRQPREKQTYLWFFDRLMIVVALAGCFIRIGNFMNSEIIGQPTHRSYGVLFAREVIQEIQASSKAIDKVSLTKSKEKQANDNHYPPVTLTITFKNALSEEQAIRSFLEHHIKHLLAEEFHVKKHIAEEADQPLRYELSKNRKGAYVAHISTQGIVRHPAQLYESFSCFALFLLLFYRWRSKKSLLNPGELFGLSFTIIFGLRIGYELIKPGKVVFSNNLITITVPQMLSIPLMVVGLLLLLYSQRASSRPE